MSPDLRRFRRGQLSDVLSGIEAADRAGLKVKIDAVAQKSRLNPAPVCGAHGRGIGITFIEAILRGDIEAARFNRHLPLTQVGAQLARHFTLYETDYHTGGLARLCMREKPAASSASSRR